MLAMARPQRSAHAKEASLFGSQIDGGFGILHLSGGCRKMLTPA
jgi:hypothetical protein